jgi:hypothetical protein
LIAGCAAAGTAVLAVVILIIDVAHLWLDPRVGITRS